jgi:hypothetical protein
MAGKPCAGLVGVEKPQQPAGKGCQAFAHVSVVSQVLNDDQEVLASLKCAAVSYCDPRRTAG